MRSPTIPFFIFLPIVLSVSVSKETKSGITQSALWSIAAHGENLESVIQRELETYAAECCYFRGLTDCPTKQIAYWAWIPRYQNIDYIDHLRRHFQPMHPGNTLDMITNMCGGGPSLDLSETVSETRKPSSNAENYYQPDFFPYFAIPLKGQGPGTHGMQHTEPQLLDHMRDRAALQYDVDVPVDFFLYTASSPCTKGNVDRWTTGCVQKLFRFAENDIIRGWAPWEVEWNYDMHSLNVGFRNWWKANQFQSLVEARDCFCSGDFEGPIYGDYVEGLDFFKDLLNDEDEEPVTDLDFTHALSFVKIGEEGDPTDSEYRKSLDDNRC